MRHGQTAQVQHQMLEFDSQGVPVWSFKGRHILKGETDGSSFPNGGLRATHTAAAYLAIDPTSPVFLRGDTIFVPAAMVSYHGHALDEKTPLLRSLDALSREGTRLLAHLNYNVSKVFVNIGLEQEFFFVPREAFLRRPDLQLAGRSVIGKMPARGQELSDHCKSQALKMPQLILTSFLIFFLFFSPLSLSSFSLQQTWLLLPWPPHP